MRCISNKSHKIINFVLSVVFICGCIKSVYADNTSGVLVAAENSKINKISIIEVRRMYLGMTISKDSGITKPVINRSDQKLYKSFLKNIMRMTEKGYKRKLIKRKFRQGSEKLAEATSKEELLKYLLEHPDCVSVMSEQNANNTKGIKLIQKLW